MLRFCYPYPSSFFCQSEFPSSLSAADFLESCSKESSVPQESLVPSDSYLKILNAVSESGYFTAEAEEACLFILSLDTLDRDLLSQVASLSFISF
jgi:hypothetical protein